MISSDAILIIGKIPPPIGGVTTHIYRLLEHLEDSCVAFRFISLDSENLLQILKQFHKYKVIHLHTSNVWLRLFLSIYSLLFNNKLILTYHGNLGRYNAFLNWIDNLSVKFTSVPIVLNQQSYKRAILINKNVRLVPAFIPPKEEISKENLFLAKESLFFKKKYNKVYCTNAFDVTFDKYGNEIYGISSLVELFNSLNEYGFIISDPSGNYKKYLLKKKITINDNILILNYNHSFYSVLKLTDGFIRSTTTDGDSLSVKEALHLGKIVYCTDCIDRPKGVILFKTHDYKQLKNFLVKEDFLEYFKKKINVENGFIKLEKIYLENI